MQNNVTDLSQKLQRSLDNNYNVIDMPAVIEIISTLEKTAVTKELLETTRLGKYINELRRRTSNESLAKRAKELVKKWRDLILPDPNGQISKATNNSSTTPSASERSDSPDTGAVAVVQQLKRKRPARTPPDATAAAKKPLLNGIGARELDFSDNSNCSVKDLKKTDVIFINSDSNSSLPDQMIDSLGSTDTAVDVVDGSNQVPKKRGRKKGSKNHKNLLIAAEESFTNKMVAVSRSSKVKTTQELLADLQNRTVVSKQNQDIELRAAQLTESLSRIDQKLNPQKQINKNVTPLRGSAAAPPVTRTTSRTSRTPAAEWPSRSTTDIVLVQSDDEIVDVVGTEEVPAIAPPVAVASEPLTIAGLLSQLPPIDLACLKAPDDVPVCSCPLPPVQQIQLPPDKITVQIVGEEQPTKLFSPPLDFTAPKEEVKEECTVLEVADVHEPETDDSELLCDARLYLRNKYNLDGGVGPDALRPRCVENVTGNRGAAGCERADVGSLDGLYVNIVPNLATELTESTASENYNKYSISIHNSDCSDVVKREASSAVAAPSSSSSSSPPTSSSCDTKRTDDIVALADNKRTPSKANCDVFRGWHQTLDVISYNGEMLTILPYVIID